MLKEIFIIGVGGQGALSIGEILAIAGNIKNYSVSLYPFYGSAMRGSESGCIVKIDTEGNEIINPTINSPDDFLILSDKFFDKYKRFKNDASKFYSANDLDSANKNDKNLNLLLLKKYIDDSKLFDSETIDNTINLKFHRP